MLDEQGGRQSHERGDDEPNHALGVRGTAPRRAGKDHGVAGTARRLTHRQTGLGGTHSRSIDAGTTDCGRHDGYPGRPGTGAVCDRDCLPGVACDIGNAVFVKGGRLCGNRDV